jgi:hypothetical protein
VEIRGKKTSNYLAIFHYAIFFIGRWWYIHGSLLEESVGNPKISTYGKASVSEHMGWVCNVVLMNVYLGLEKPQGVGILDEGARWAGEGNEGVSLRATRERGGRILSQQGGFQVSGKGQQGKQGEQEEQGDNHVHNLSHLCI